MASLPRGEAGLEAASVIGCIQPAESHAPRVVNPLQ